MPFQIQDLAIPAILKEIPDPPKKLRIQGKFPNPDLVFLSVVGSRKYTAYGRQTCERLIAGLRGYPVVIVSGLALGIDGIAHRVALQNGILTLAVPGSGLDECVLYPRAHLQLAREILASGGALISEFEDNFKPRPESFPQRNRIMAGMSKAVLVIEAEERSGTLITARLAAEYNRDVFAVPGPIHSPTSAGPHMLIQKGACLVSKSDDILTALGIEPSVTRLIHIELSEEESLVRNALIEPLPRDALIRKLGLPISKANVLLSSLELRGYIQERLGTVFWI